MNLVKFPVASTNIFPIANSKSGGQLLTEFNLRSRESVQTPEEVKYTIGPSYTHGKNDFKISKETDTLGNEISNQRLQISEGKALVNGHYIESLVPVIVDMPEENAYLRKNNQNILSGNLVVGLRVMYSTESTTSGTIKVENEEGLYEGIQVVILPEDEFKLPKDSPTDPNKVTAHLKLGTFTYRNGKISNIVQNDNKICSISADRLDNSDEYLSETYVSKTGLNTKYHYVFGGEQENWCRADDSLMIWDRKLDLKSIDEGTDRPSPESYFRYNPETGKTELVLAHKQPDNMKDTKGSLQYYPDKLMTIPSANYNNGKGGVVDKSYTNNIKNIANTINRLYILPTGKMKLYIESLTDKADQLPNISKNIGWKPGDYIVVGQDYVYGEEGGTEGNIPSTLYMILPGKITSLRFAGETVQPLDIYDNGMSWEMFINTVVKSVPWNDIVSSALVQEDSPESIDWDAAIDSALNTKGLLAEMNWDEICEQAIQDSQSTDISWDQVIEDAWSNAKTDYSNKLAEDQSKIDSKLTTYTNTLAGYQQILDDPDTPQSKKDEVQALVNALEPAIALEKANKIRADITQQIFESVYSEENEGTFPVAGLVDKLQELAEADEDYTDWSAFLRNEISKGVAYSGGIDWSDVILSAKNKYGRSINWNEVFLNAIQAELDENNRLVEEQVYGNIPKELADGDGILLGEQIQDTSFNKRDFLGENGINQLFGISYDTSTEGYPRGRTKIIDNDGQQYGPDYYRVEVRNEEENKIYLYYYAVATSTGYEYCDPPILLTGGVPLAEETVAGGFYNVPDSSYGAGYVYRNDEGYLQLLDYDLLATGVLAYQLGENFTCPSGLAASEIQVNLDEYVNDRVAFPNDNQKSYVEEQIKSGLQGEMVDSSVIHVYVNLSIEDEPYEINIKNIDSRFSSSVYLHLSGEATQDCVVNILNCQRIRLDIKMSSLPTINLYDSCLYYDSGVLDKISNISGLTLWYKRYSSDDPKLIVSDMSIEYFGSPEYVSTDSYWDVDSPNDNHYKYALKGLTFGSDGTIVGAKLLVTDNISDTADIDEGTYCSSFEFEFPQGVGLDYPVNRISKSIKVTGSFITAYPAKDDNNGYYIKDNSFSALTYGYTNSYIDINNVSDQKLKGVISFRTMVSYVTNIYGFGSGQDGYESGTSLDPWEPGKYHVFEGGTID